MSRTPILNRLRWRLTGWLGLRVLLMLAGVAGVAALAALALDAAIDLSEPARLAAPWIVGGCALAVIALGLGRALRFRETYVAKLFERTNPSLGTRLTNAVELGRRPGETPVEEFLRRETVELGRRTASRLRAWPIVGRSVRGSVAVLGAAAVGWFAFVLLAGDVMQVVLPRFLNPHGDHPPYSRLHIEVTPAEAEVLFGGQIEIRATASGRPVDKLWLVARSGTNEARTMMFLAPDQTFFQTLSNLREPAEYFVTDGQARSRRFPLGIRYTPQITMVEVTTEFPEYTGKPARTAKLAEEPQSWPAGTRVRFRVASNRPLQSGELSLTPVLGGAPQSVVLQPEANDSVVSGEFTLAEPVAFALSVRDIGGIDGAEPRRGRFNILPDERPRLFVLEPGRNAVATPSFSVPVRVQAQDDYGISRVIWLRGHNRSIERPVNMKVTLRGGAQSVEAAGAFELGKLGVRPGDVIEYYFEAADNDPKGPNLALSRLFKLEIISDEQYAQILRQAAARKALFEPYFKLGAWLKRLAERAYHLETKALARSADAETIQKEAAALAEDLEKYHAELGKLLRQAALFDIEQAFRETLVAQHTFTGQTKEKLQNAAASGRLEARQLGEIAEELHRLSETEELAVTVPARQIAAVAHLLARADSFVKLAREQAVLAQMLRRFAERATPLTRLEQIEVQELAHQQRRIREGLRVLAESLPELLAKVPGDPPFDPLREDVKAFLSAVAEAKIEEDMSGADEALSDLDAMTGFTLAQMAAEKMDRLVARCREMEGFAEEGLRFQPSLQEALGKTLQQILAAMGAGDGADGRDGYSLFNDDLALYGPNVELAGEQAGGASEAPGAPTRGLAQVAGDASDPGLAPPGTPGRVRLQPDAKFPLRYRDLVGDYFRAIAESEFEEGGER